MFKKISFEIGYQELLKMTNMDSGDFDHERDAPTPTGIKAILRGFRYKGDKIDIKEAKERLLNTLIEKKEIDTKKGWIVQFTPTHRWSGYDDDGYAHSIYEVQTEVYKAIKY